MKVGQEMHTMKSVFSELDARLKRFGKILCKFHKNRKNKPGNSLECNHPAMGYGGMTRNTACELINCPRILYNDEGE